jgi:LmbE family N-acetylglucosaminyl deacetylase
MKTLRIVAVGAHPDDIELSMAGLLICAARAGHRVTWLVATDGAAGSGGRDADLAAKRADEAAAGAASAEATLELLGFPDGQLAWFSNAPAVIGERLATLAPDLIVTHPLNDYHADHRAVARIVSDTSPIGVPVLRADSMLGVHFVPELIFDISEVFDAKLAALANHASQGGLSLADAVRIWNRFRGLQSGAARFVYAEAYALDHRLSAPVSPLLDRIGRHLLL